MSATTPYLKPGLAKPVAAGDGLDAPYWDGLKEGKLEYKGRRDAEAQMVDAAGIVALLQGKLCAA